MENMKIYEQARLVPDEAKKTIKAGRLKGFTDVNPMWRIKRLTELFGPCGIGWKYEPIHRDIQTLCGETCVFVDIMLYVKDEDGNWSEGIYGTGGSKLVAQEKTGAYVSDEAFKMAQTDALSVACKNLGIGADVYFDKDRTKYTAVTEEPKKAEPAEEPKKAEPAEEKATDAEKRRLWKLAVSAGLDAREFFLSHGTTYRDLTAGQYVMMVNELKAMEQEDVRG